MAEPVGRPTLAQVMISWFVSSSPASGSALTAQSLEPASDSVSPSLSVSLPLTPVCVSFTLKIKILKKNFLKSSNLLVTVLQAGNPRVEGLL